MKCWFDSSPFQSLLDWSLRSNRPPVGESTDKVRRHPLFEDRDQMILYGIKFKEKWLAFAGDPQNPQVVWVTSPAHKKAVRRSDIRIRSILKMMPPGAQKVLLEDTLKELPDGKEVS